jgi:L-fucose isomerase-like protein
MPRRRRKRRIKGVLNLIEDRYKHLTVNSFSNDARRMAAVCRRFGGLEVGESVIVIGRSGAKIEIFRDYDGLLKRMQIARSYNLSDELEINEHLRNNADTSEVELAIKLQSKMLREKKERSDKWYRSNKKKPKKRDKRLEIVWQF